MTEKQPPETSAASSSETSEESPGIASLNSHLSADYRIQDLAFIALGVLSMSYGSLILYNTGTFTVDVQSTITTFGYVPPVSAMVGCLVLYLLAFVFLISVGSSWSPRLTVLSWFTSLVYIGVGVIFYLNVFDESRVRERVQGGKTDAYVLQKEGASQFLNGNNPYQYDYSNEILNQVPGYFRTPLSPHFTPEDLTEPVNIVTSLDYPPVSFLWYVPSELLGISGAVQDLLVISFVMVLLLVVAPKALRPVVPVVFMLNWNMLLFPVSFVPDVGWVFLVIVAIFTVHYPKTNAVIWALAANYRPQPILIATFFAIYVYKEFGLAYLKQWIPTGLLSTALINLPFAVWTGFSAYWSYITLPIRITIPPGGVGPAMIFSTELVSEAAATGAAQSLFTFAIFVVWGLSLAAVFVYYDRLGAGALAAPGLTLWFHWRSFENYLLWFPLFVFVAYLVGFPHRNPMLLLLQRMRTARRKITDRVYESESEESPVPASTGEQP